MHPVARLHQCLHQPVPVVGGLHHQPFDDLPIRRQRRQHPFGIVAQTLAVHYPIPLVQKGHNTVVGM
jgi:hypothetical protein